EKYGNKVGEGFYKKVKTDKGKEYKVINPKDLEYESQTNPAFDIANKAQKKFDSPAKRLRFLVQSDTEVGQFIWQIQCDLLLYAAHRIPEITEIGRASCRERG